MANPRLRREMHDLREGTSPEQMRRRIGVGEIETRELEVTMAREAREPRLLERDVVIRIEVVDTRDLRAPRYETLYRMHADKSGAAGHQNTRRLHATNTTHGTRCVARGARRRSRSTVSSLLPARLPEETTTIPPATDGQAGQFASSFAALRDCTETQGEFSKHARHHRGAVGAVPFDD